MQQLLPKQKTIHNLRKLDEWERLLYWVYEREYIRLAKAKGLPKPWTEDSILQSYRFCNVRRMDDAVSVWLMHNWYKPYRGHSMMPVAVALARFFNKPTTLEAIGFPISWEPRTWKGILTKLRKHQPIFNAAYLVRAVGGEDKVDSVLYKYVKPLYDDVRKGKFGLDTNSMFNTWKAVQSYYGFGSFTAGQVTADLRWAINGKWMDAKTFAPKGPGSQRGINRLYGYSTNSHWSDEEFAEGLSEVIDFLSQRLPKWMVERLEAQDYQNCLCEWDKFERCLWNEGRPKQLYPGA